MVSVFDFDVGDTNEETSPDSSDEKDEKVETPTAEGKRPESETPQVPDESRMAALERQVGEMNNNIVNLVAENAALKTREKESEQARYSAEDLKKFGLEEGGIKQFDAAKIYTDQALDSVKTEIRAEFEREAKNNAVIQEMLSIYPELSDPNSEFSRAVENEKLSIMRRGLAKDDNGAYNLALHKIARTKMPRSGSNEDYSRERRIESAGGEGAPSGGSAPEDKPKPQDRLSKEDMELGRNMGLNMSDKDVRKRILARKRMYESRRSI